MSQKIVFTIVAKNYLSLARALGHSLKRYNDVDVRFIIFIADEPDQYLNINDEDGNIILVSSLGIKYLDDWAFKYNVTEFCTAVKPTCFKYIFKTFNCTSAIYFDPDIFVFNSLAPIFNDLVSKDIVVTPHYLSQQINYTGDQSDASTLFVGIYNFGFVALNNILENIILLDWWENRLSSQCYADKQDSLHTDQKWADFFPVYAFNRLHISNASGYNLAPWNLFEREIYLENKKFMVRNRISAITEGSLVFVHFAGYDPKDLKLIHKDFWNMTIDKYPDYDLVRSIYNQVTEKFHFIEKRQIPYSYAYYSDGTYIHDYHRRLYRALTENESVFANPFDVNNEFYLLLKKYGLITANKPQKQTMRTLSGFENKRIKINKALKLIFKIIGVDRYFLLMKFLNRYTRPENQTFLLDRNVKKIY